MARTQWIWAASGLLAVVLVVNVVFLLKGPFLEERFSTGQLSAYWEGWSAVGAVLLGIGVPAALTYLESKRARRGQEENARLERVRFSAWYTVTGVDGGVEKRLSWHNAASTPWIQARILIATDKLDVGVEYGPDRVLWHEATGQEPGSADVISRIDIGTVVPGVSDSQVIKMAAYAGILTFRHPVDKTLRWSPLGGPISAFIPNVAGDRAPLEL